MWNAQFGRRRFLKKTGAATVATAIALHGFKTEVLAGVSGGGSWHKWTYSRSGSGTGTSLTNFGAATAEARSNANAAFAADKWKLVSQESHTGPAQTYYVPAAGPDPAFSPSDEAFFTGSVSCELTQVKIGIFFV